MNPRWKKKLMHVAVCVIRTHAAICSKRMLKIDLANKCPDGPGMDRTNAANVTWNQRAEHKTMSSVAAAGSGQNGWCKKYAISHNTLQGIAVQFALIWS